MPFTLTKEFKFEAAHVLLGHDGKCARLHGHSWVGEVVLEGDKLVQDGPKAGMLADFGDVSAALEPLVDDYLDHHFLNETLATDRPTSEFVAEWVYNRLRGKLPGLSAVVIRETCTSSCRYGTRGGA